MFMNFSTLMTRLDKLSQVIRSTRLLRGLLFHRVLGGAEHRQVLAENFKTVVDIGANRGQFTLAARRWNRKARIIAFEPLAEAATKFRKVFQGDLKVTLHQAAIGPVGGEATIHVAASDDSSSLLPILSIQERLFPGTAEIQTDTVKMGRLSDYVAPEEIDEPALLKIDVQGYELEALRGCEELLGRFSHVYAECSFIELYSGQALSDDIIEWLRKRGWCLSGIYNMIYTRKGKSVQADFLFVNLRSANYSVPNV
jgi:FkbM family methyltransferase